MPLPPALQSTTIAPIAAAAAAAPMLLLLAIDGAAFEKLEIGEEDVVLVLVVTGFNSKVLLSLLTSVTVIVASSSETFSDAENIHTHTQHSRKIIVLETKG